MPTPRQAFLPTPADRKIAEEIKRLRLLAGLSQAKLAKRVGLSAHTIWRVETLQRGLNVQSLNRIEEVLGPVRGETVDSFSPIQQAGHRGVEVEHVTSEERQLLSIYRVLPDDMKDTLLGRAQRLFSQAEGAGTLQKTMIRRVDERLTEAMETVAERAREK